MKHSQHSLRSPQVAVHGRAASVVGFWLFMCLTLGTLAVGEAADVSAGHKAPASPQNQAFTAALDAANALAASVVLSSGIGTYTVQNHDVISSVSQSLAGYSGQVIVEYGTFTAL